MQTWLWLPLACLPYMVVGLQLSLIQMGDAMVVYDYSTNNPLCYPTPHQDPEHVHLPTSHQTWDGSPGYDENIGRVICRGMGFTHLERVYKVPADKDMGGSRWMVECLGYEALITHCITFDPEKSDCPFLMGLECGRCSRKVDLSEGSTLVVTSPEYPAYSDDVLCVWRLQAPTLATITLNFSDFRLPNLNSEGYCTRGMLEVAEVVVEDDEPVTRTIASMCGSAVPSPLTVQANALLLKYTSGVFYPRPFSGGGGFRASVTASAFVWYPTRLKRGEVVAVVLGVLLLLLILVFICYIWRRRRLVRRRSKQRKLMNERLASQRPSSHEVALTAMLASMRTFAQTTGVPVIPAAGAGGGIAEGIPWMREDSVTRTTSVPIHHPAYPVPPPPPLPTSAPPPPKRQLTVPVVNSHLRQDSSEMYEQPIYVEVDQIHRSPMDSYIQLDDIPKSRFVEEIHVCSSDTPPVSSQPATLTTGHTNDLNLCSSSSPRLEKSSKKLNVWPSSSSLTPSPKGTASSRNTPSRVTPSNIMNIVNSRSLSSRGSSVSSITGSISPFPGHTPASPPASTCGSSSGGAPPSSCGVLFRKQNDQQNVFPLLNTTNLERVAAAASSSSSESVFTLGEYSVPMATPCVCGKVHPRPPRRGLTSAPAPKGHLSKSCGDVSPATPTPQRKPMLEEMVRSEPSLPRGQQPAGFVGPVLRRVSQMFLGSSPFLSPTQEAKKLPEARKTEANKLLENKGSGSKRPASRGSADGGSWGDRMILGSNSPRRSTSSTAASFQPFRYTRLESVSNGYWASRAWLGSKDDQGLPQSPEDNVTFDNTQWKVSRSHESKAT
ncbi:uncharacterized protein [Panulirus ornatus]|uniref:uncharacterized protein isoform X2 n=1 Tax=Panulirus ornatus TaxID=150431 RepID=UPI003A88F9FE